MTRKYISLMAGMAVFAWGDVVGECQFPATAAVPECGVPDLKVNRMECAPQEEAANYSALDVPLGFCNELAAEPVDQMTDGVDGGVNEDEQQEQIVGNAPDECNCGECYQRVCKYEKCYYEEYVTVNKEVKCEKQNRRFVPEYYQKLRCKYVPQYYYETFCRYVPEYYTTSDTYIVHDKQLVKKYKLVPKYYFKKRPGAHCE